MLIAYGLSAAAFAVLMVFAIRHNQPALAIVGMLPLVVTSSVHMALTSDTADTYTTAVQKTLERDYGATTSAASVSDLPYENAMRSRDQVLLTTPAGKKLCIVESGTHGPADLSVICAGAELPKLTTQAHP